MAAAEIVRSPRQLVYKVAPLGIELWRWWGDELRERGCLYPRIVLHGGYGKGNLGDDAILEVLLAQVREAFPSGQITVVCHGPARVRDQHRIPAYHFADWHTLKAILNADVYIIGGGGIINRINTYSGFRHLRVLDPKGKFLFVAAALAKMRGARLDFHAIGATSFPDPIVYWLARFVLNCSDALTARDKRSREILQRAGVRGPIPVVLDPVTELEPALPEVAIRLLADEGVAFDKLKIGVNFRYVAEPDIDNAQTIHTVARLIEWLSDECDAQVIFLPFGRHPKKVVENDLAFAYEVAGLVDGCQGFHILERDCRPAEMKAILGQMDLCVLERLHAVILAAPTGVPIISVIYDDKVAAFTEIAGLEDTNLPLRQFDFEVARERIMALLAARNEGR